MCLNQINKTMINRFVLHVSYGLWFFNNSVRWRLNCIGSIKGTTQCTIELSFLFNHRWQWVFSLNFTNIDSANSEEFKQTILDVFLN